MPSIGVLEHYQKATDKPTRRIKRSGGQSLVRSGLATWIEENVLLQMRSAVRTLPESLRTLHGRCYIPDKLPSHKALGTRVIGPVVEQDGFGRARIVLANMIAAGR